MTFIADQRVTVVGGNHEGETGTVVGITEASVAMDDFGGDIAVALDCGPDGMYGWASLVFPPSWLRAL